MGYCLNRNQSPHAHQVICSDGQTVEPIYPFQSTQLYLAQSRTQLGPAEDPLDELAFALTDRTPLIRSFLRMQTILLQVSLHILADVRRYVAFAQCFYESLLLIARIGTQRDLLPGS